uniref:WGS project CAEQ00000000 data, annotated contig 848 n=1 Tax=Trypanosoma congolense (strain IL3000) TaxID=1068625 RepID=F9WIY5_TRYCI|nr:unnamed protein product [Trypanosoma congolense IL3000]
MLRQASFVDNEISFCSIGFVAGNNCHPFLLGNNIHHNNFLGILLRRGSKAACCRCKVVNNSWAGLYAAPHSYGAFAFGEIRSNNGLCRPENDASSIRCFAGFAFTEKADELPTCFRESSELEEEAYGSISSTLSSYGDIVASGIGLICKVISCPSSCFSLADTAFPSGFLEPGPSFSGEAPEHYDWGWAADGGIGVWITLGSMTDVSDTLIEGNRNIGVFFSFGVESHHKNMCKFILEDCEIPEIPGGETVNGHSVKTYEQNVQRLLFTTNDVCIHQSYLLTEAAPNGNASGDHKEESPKAASTPRDVEDEFLFSPLLLSRPPTIRSNTIVRNGCGAYIQLTQPLEAEPVAQVVEPVQPETPPPPPKVRKRGSVAGKSAGNATQSGLPAIRKNKVAAPRKQKNTEEEPVSACTPEPKSIWADILPPHMLSEVVIPAYAVSVQENAIYDNLNFGILCHHILELHCGDFIARRSEIGVAAKLTMLCA